MKSVSAILVVLMFFGSAIASIICLVAIAALAVVVTAIAVDGVYRLGRYLGSLT